MKLPARGSLKIKPVRGNTVFCFVFQLNIGFLAANDAQSFVFEEAYVDIQQSIKIDDRLNIT